MIWILLGGHLLIFMAVLYVHPIALLHLAMVAAWTVLFLTGTALYFSSRLRRTTSAVMATFSTVVVLWLVVPLLLGAAVHGADDAWHATNPLVQAAVVAAGGTYDDHRLGSYDWPVGPLPVGETTVVVFASTLAFSGSWGLMAS